MVSPAVGGGMDQATKVWRRMVGALASVKRAAPRSVVVHARCRVVEVAPRAELSRGAVQKRRKRTAREARLGVTQVDVPIGAVPVAGEAEALAFLRSE